MCAYPGGGSASGCSPAAISYPTIYGVEFLTLEAHLVTNFSQFVRTGFYANHGSVNVSDATFCNVSISYTHPGENDAVKTQVWLPIGTWNGRLQAVGGGGWQAGLNYPALMGMSGAIGEGYSTVSTDAGLGSEMTPKKWGLVSPGNVNWYLLQNLASVSLNEMAIIGKSISESFYGVPPKYSYFTGCSQGGRQGLMLAQRYPDAFDGIAAAAPAINWNSFLVQDLWPSVLMDKLRAYPPSCEFDAITAAAIEACDAEDGVVDGVISHPETCKFDPMDIVGRTINCTNFGRNWTISSSAAEIVRETVSNFTFDASLTRANAVTSLVVGRKDCAKCHHLVRTISRRRSNWFNNRYVDRPHCMFNKRNVRERVI